MGRTRDREAKGVGVRSEETFKNCGFARSRGARDDDWTVRFCSCGKGNKLMGAGGEGSFVGQD